MTVGFSVHGLGQSFGINGLIPFKSIQVCAGLHRVRVTSCAKFESDSLHLFHVSLDKLQHCTRQAHAENI